MFRRTAIVAAFFLALSALAFADAHREVRNKVQPTYPEVAKQMHLQGTVRLQLTVAPNGSVRRAEVLGGNPVLANSAIQAVEQWRYEPATSETTEQVEIHFTN